MKKTFISLLGLIVCMSSYAWTWTGETIVANTDCYLYNIGTSLFANTADKDNDNNLVDAETVTATWKFSAASGTTDIKIAPNYTDDIHGESGWTIGGDVNGYKFSRRNVFTFYLKGNGTQIKSELTDNASNKWLWISVAQKTVYDNRNLAFSATVGNASTITGCSSAPTAAVSVEEYELQNYAERTASQSTATFTAGAPAENYNFDGWYSDAEFTHKVSAEETYEVALSYNQQSITLYAKYVQGARTPLIEKSVANLEWDTTYNLSDIITSNSNGAITVTLGGETITELNVPLFEDEITIHVSQAAVAGEYLAAEEDLTFHVTPKESCPGNILVGSALTNEGDESGKIADSNTYELTLDVASNISNITFEYKCDFGSNKTIYVDQFVNGAWSQIWTTTERPLGWTNGSITVTADEIATKIRFRMEGWQTGGLYIRNVVVMSAISTLASTSELNIITADANIDEQITVDYVNIDHIQYEPVVEILSSTNDANVSVTIAPEDGVVLDNGCGDAGTYAFDITYTADKYTTISAQAHFFTADGKDLLVPFTITYGAQVTETRSELLNEGVYKYGTICLPLDVEAEEITALAEQAVFYEVTSASLAGAIIEEVSALEAGKAYVFRALAESFTITTVIGEPRTEAIAQDYIHGNLAAQALDVPANDYILSGNMLHQIVTPATATVAQYRAYFSLPAGADIQARLIERSDVVTDIENVETLDLNKFLLNGKVFIRRNGQLFDLNGKLVK